MKELYRHYIIYSLKQLKCIWEMAEKVHTSSPSTTPSSLLKTPQNVPFSICLSIAFQNVMTNTHVGKQVICSFLHLKFSRKKKNPTKRKTQKNKWRGMKYFFFLFLFLVSFFFLLGEKRRKKTINICKFCLAPSCLRFSKQWELFFFSYYRERRLHYTSALTLWTGENDLR